MNISNFQLPISDLVRVTDLVGNWQSAIGNRK